MAEVKEREELSQAQGTETAAVQAAESAPAKVPLKEKWKAMPRKKRRKIVRLVILLLVLAVIGGILYKVLGGKQEGESEIITDVVQYGSITSIVDGSGLAKAKSSETITCWTCWWRRGIWLPLERRFSPSTARRRRPLCKKPAAIWRATRSS